MSSKLVIKLREQLDNQKQRIQYFEKTLFEKLQCLNHLEDKLKRVSWFFLLLFDIMVKFGQQNFGFFEGLPCCTHCKRPQLRFIYELFRRKKISSTIFPTRVNLFREITAVCELASQISLS